MTGTSLHARGLSHLQSVRSLNKTDTMAKHTIEAHNGMMPGFTMKPMERYKTLLRRYKGEGVLIEKQQSSKQMLKQIKRQILTNLLKYQKPSLK